MPRVYGVYSFAAWVSLLLLIFSVIELGSLQAPLPTLAGLGLCDGVACWYGISVQHSSAEEMYRVLDEHGYTVIDTYIFSTDVVAQASSANSCNFRAHLTLEGGVNLLTLTDCLHLRLGDVMALFGTPSTLYLGQTVCLMNVQYDEGLSIIVRMGDDTFSPYSEVVEITLYEASLRSEWRGFAPLWYYRQLAAQPDTGLNCG